MSKKIPGYGEAMDELEGILSAIEQDERLDIDELSVKVERAAVLIKLLRDKLRGTELRVTKVVEELKEEEASLQTSALTENSDKETGEKSDRNEDEDKDLPF